MEKVGGLIARRIRFIPIRRRNEWGFWGLANGGDALVVA